MSLVVGAARPRGEQQILLVTRAERALTAALAEPAGPRPTAAPEARLKARAVRMEMRVPLPAVAVAARVELRAMAVVVAGAVAMSPARMLPAR